MSFSSAYGLIDIVLFFGVILAFLIWQLIVTRRSIRQDLERALREARNDAPTSRSFGSHGCPDRTADDR
jgi:hypothetical protein